MTVAAALAMQRPSLPRRVMMASLAAPTGAASVIRTSTLPCQCRSIQTPERASYPCLDRSLLNLHEG